MGHQEPDSEHQPANSGVGPFSPGRKKWEMWKDLGILIPKKKEAGRGEWYMGILAKQTVVSGRDAVIVNLESKNTHIL